MFCDEALDLVESIASGEVKVSRATESGSEVVFAVLGAGDALGELGALEEGASRSADARAILAAAAVLADPADEPLLRAVHGSGDGNRQRTFFALLQINLAPRANRIRPHAGISGGDEFGYGSLAGGLDLDGTR